MGDLRKTILMCYLKEDYVVGVQMKVEDFKF